MIINCLKSSEKAREFVESDLVVFVYFLFVFEVELVLNLLLDLLMQLRMVEFALRNIRTIH